MGGREADGQGVEEEALNSIPCPPLLSCGCIVDGFT